METAIFQMIKKTHQEIEDMTPPDGFSSPRDIKLTKEVNKKAAVMRCLIDAMRVYNKDFSYEK